MAKKDFMSLMKEKTVDVRPSLLSAEENIKSQLVVFDELRNLIPPLTDDELAQLEQNILKHGVKDPLTIWETTQAKAGLGTSESPAFVLVDGHNRYQIVRKHGRDFRINLVHFDSLAEVKDYMIDYQLGRRNLTAEQASYLRGMRYNQQKTRRGSNLRADAPAVNIAEVLASEYGVSSRTIRRDGEFASTLEQLDPELKRDVLAGKLSKTAAQKLANQSSLANTPAETSSLSAESKNDKSARRIEALEGQIRKLTEKSLDTQNCLKLIQKANELLGLLSAK
ncbi:hypothetical protein F5984_23400 [Rudanella paleaurantiibacter]|uniref:ParB/Sulfiredoxin domain-containing protein n=1 Tax=Rudanella paleaurantiibacter TaxID=2614655 RepID=A0A7J5TT95_9BACT|nr:hypothetical protein [Rudanella paleaurantiibacter]KAB7726861.1 hypothetical protein F5984_23400 [Rudanella paleaurantiibacter]